jgi:GT2 family glycosyltransferase
MDVTSVVIVNYNGSHFLRDCLNALRSQSLPLHRIEIIIVDNNSHDESLKLLQSEFPWVRIIRSKENLGFAGGNNLGFVHAHGKTIALINNDTVADPNWLKELLESLECDLTTGAVASKLLFHSEPKRLNSGGMRLLSDGHGTDRGFRDLDQGQFEQGEEVFAGCGAGLLFRRELLNETNGFDERFFMYYEDLDLAWRARHLGWNIRYSPRSIVRHIHCGSSGEWSPFFTYHVERNRVLTNLKNGDLMIGLWTSLSLFSRLRKALVRLIQTRGNRKDWQIVQAYLWAVGMLFLLTPMMLLDRYRYRVTRRRK